MGRHQEGWTWKIVLSPRYLQSKTPRRAGSKDAHHRQDQWLDWIISDMTLGFDPARKLLEYVRHRYGRPCTQTGYLFPEHDPPPLQSRLTKGKPPTFGYKGPARGAVMPGLSDQPPI